MENKEIYVCVKNAIAMCHAYPYAMARVRFLRNVHRHIFYTQTCIEVYHGNRDIEFFDLQNKIQKILDVFKESYNESSFSCEDVALSMLTSLDMLGYGSTRKINIEVSEDNENFVRVLSSRSS